MGGGIKSKLSTDLGLIKNRVESQVGKLGELVVEREKKHEVVFGEMNEIKDLPYKLLVRWKSFLRGRFQSVRVFQLGFAATDKAFQGIHRILLSAAGCYQAASGQLSIEHYVLGSATVHSNFICSFNCGCCNFTRLRVY